jgi:hypothetical protein
MIEDKIINGRIYRYDPDYDCYYRAYEKEDLTHMSKWGWVYVVMLLGIVCFMVDSLH